MSKKCWCLVKTLLGIGIIYVHVCPKIRRRMGRCMDKFEDTIKDKFY